jgi:hypothetical protein
MDELMKGREIGLISAGNPGICHRAGWLSEILRVVNPERTE